MWEPKPRAHYEEIFAQRMDRKNAHLYMLRDRDLMPTSMPGAAKPGGEPAERDSGWDDGNSRYRGHYAGVHARHGNRQYGQLPVLDHREPAEDESQLQLRIEVELYRSRPHHGQPLAVV